MSRHTGGGRAATAAKLLRSAVPHWTVLHGRARYVSVSTRSDGKPGRRRPGSGVALVAIAAGKGGMSRSDGRRPGVVAAVREPCRAHVCCHPQPIRDGALSQTGLAFANRSVPPLGRWTAGLASHPVHIRCPQDSFGQADIEQLRARTLRSQRHRRDAQPINRHRIRIGSGRRIAALPVLSPPASTRSKTSHEPSTVCGTPSTGSRDALPRVIAQPGVPPPGRNNRMSAGTGVIVRVLPFSSGRLLAIMVAIGLAEAEPGVEPTRRLVVHAHLQVGAFRTSTASPSE